MKKGKKLTRRILSFVLTAALVAGLMPGNILTVSAEQADAQAEENTGNTKTIAGLGTSVIADPTAPASASDAWKGSYVYYGNYDADGDDTAEPVKYRVLDANTTKFGGTTMLLDCDSILYYTPFDGKNPYISVWTRTDDAGNITYTSPICASLNGDDFLNKEGVFTTAEKNAIAASTVATHALTTDSENGVNVASWTQSVFLNYVALTGEHIFLLDVEDVSNGAYGYSMKDSGWENRKKTGSSAAKWWLRSAFVKNGVSSRAGNVDDDGSIDRDDVSSDDPGVSPAFNVNLSLYSSHLSSLELPGRQAQSIS